MSATTSGRIREKESGRVVPGLLVRTRAKSFAGEDLLPSAVTDGKGRFVLEYTEEQFRRLVRDKVEVYLSVYAQPLRFLMNTEAQVRQGRTRQQRIELEIPRDALAEQSPSRPAGIIEVEVQFALDQLTIHKREGFDVPRLAGFVSRGLPGAPTLLEQTHHIALPRGAKVLSLDVVPGKPVPLRGPVNPYPIQHPEPMVPYIPTRDGPPWPHAVPRPPFVPLDARLLERAEPFPKDLVVLGTPTEYLGIQLVPVVVRPMQYDPRARVFVCYPKLRFVVNYETQPATLTAELGLKAWKDYDALRAFELHAFLDDPTVHSAKEIFTTSPGEPLVAAFPECVPYVIISDDYPWPTTEIANGDGTRAPTIEEGRSPTPLPLDGEGRSVRDHFERLAEWKNSRGMRTVVVRITDIVSGNWGDFTDGGFARDLQEVIHNFIAWAGKKWHTGYVLLGGTRDIVPLRYLTAYPGVDFLRTDTDPPPAASYYVDTARPRAKLCHLGERGSPDHQARLCTADGRVIPFKGKHGAWYTSPGWYFATEDWEQPMNEETLVIVEFG